MRAILKCTWTDGEIGLASDGSAERLRRRSNRSAVSTRHTARCRAAISLTRAQAMGRQHPALRHLNRRDWVSRTLGRSDRFWTANIVAPHDHGDCRPGVVVACGAMNEARIRYKAGSALREYLDEFRGIAERFWNGHRNQTEQCQESGRCDWRPDPLRARLKSPNERGVAGQAPARRNECGRKRKIALTFSSARAVGPLRWNSVRCVPGSALASRCG